ncbi:hypothetical protein VNO78_10295 [Psophocarpus tetragonolobus]|uniref:Uncharacterized protein n=1 Tax=Psophocarpus tetragonolobus TaxID=3891 RepID=A0AAN9SLS4_PSOTE
MLMRYVDSWHMEKKWRGEKVKGNLWDCGSTLYDSYELNSLKRRLNTAIANSPLNTTTQLPQQPTHKFSPTFHKLLRFLFNLPNKFRISKHPFSLLYHNSQPQLPLFITHRPTATATAASSA